MLDAKTVLSDPERATRQWEARGVDGARVVAELQVLDEERKRAILAHDEAKARQTELSAIFRQKGAPPSDVLAARGELQELSEIIKGHAAAQKEATEAIRLELMGLPNWADESVPAGADASDNALVREVGGQPMPPCEPEDHIAIGERLGILDFEAAARISGARFAVYRGLGARLERALMSFMLDLHTEVHGYTEVMTPFLVSRATMEGTGQLPKFENDAFRTEDDYFLIPTAEVSVTNLHREQILEATELPRHYVAWSACFRREAGSYGRDVKGLTRLHQFQKVELVKICTAESSYDELEAMVTDACAVLERLELPYRVITLCTGDMGFSAAKTYDIEVWLPSTSAYREISSCSNCEDFQARRAGIRYRAARGEKPRFAHTLNGSGLAVGRTVIAVLENNLQADGSVRIPPALRPYMGGTSVIPAA